MKLFQYLIVFLSILFFQSCSSFNFPVAPTETATPEKTPSSHQGVGSKTDPYQIDSFAKLELMTTKKRTNQEYYILVKTLDLKNAHILSHDLENVHFDGNHRSGFSLKNFTTKSTKQASFFKSISNSTIKDLEIRKFAIGSFFSNFKYAGILTSTAANLRIHGLRIIDSKILISSATYAGGILAYGNNIHIDRSFLKNIFINITFSNISPNSVQSMSMGGFIGVVNGNSYAGSTYNNGFSISNSAILGGGIVAQTFNQIIGGLVGTNINHAFDDHKIENCIISIEIFNSHVMYVQGSSFLGVSNVLSNIKNSYFDISKFPVTSTAINQIGVGLTHRDYLLKKSYNQYIDFSHIFIMTPDGVEVRPLTN